MNEKIGDVRERKCVERMWQQVPYERNDVGFIMWRGEYLM